MQRILNIVGWIGTALVVAAVGLVASGRRTGSATRCGWSGPASSSSCSTRSDSGARLRRSFNRRQAKYASVAIDERPRRPRHPDCGELPLESPAEQALGPDRELGAHAVGTEPEGARRTGCTTQDDAGRSRRRLPPLPRAAGAVLERVAAGDGRLPRRRARSGEGAPVRRAGLPHPGPASTRTRRKRSCRSRSATSPAR